MTGPLAGTRYDLAASPVRIGRAPANDVVLSGADAVMVSGQHAEIFRDGEGWRIRDLDSTNGTFVDGARVSEAALRAPCTIQVGKGGPEIRFTFEKAGRREPGLAGTVVVPPDATGAEAGEGLDTEHDRQLRRAVARARMARRSGALNQTAAIMREAFASAIHGTRRRFQRVIILLAAALVIVSGVAAWRIQVLESDKQAIDARIVSLERRLAQPIRNPAEAEQLASQLSQYENQAQSLQQNLFFRLGTRKKQDDFITAEIRALLTEFGADSYSIPPEFVSAVRRYLDRYMGPDRPNMARALGEARPAMERIRSVLEQQNLPPDFAYMTLVESALDRAQKSSAGCAGLWQFTPATARAYGLRVSGGADERLSAVKETRAASKYIRELILDFGAGSSVMLALAAYNTGPAKVKQAIRSRVVDPIKQRSFWYLYRIRALPEETREYVPKVIAAMIIGRHPDRFGFGRQHSKP